MIPIRLAAVVPERFLVCDLEGKHLVGFTLGGCEVEAAEDAVAALEGLAGLVEGGLHDRVVLGEEVEFDVVADFGDDVLRLEVQALVFRGCACEDAVDDAGVALLGRRS